MKRLNTFLLALAAGIAGATASAQSAPSVETLFVNPGRFTDFRVERLRAHRQTDRLAEELRAWIAREAPRHLPAGAKLTVTITDIDMAGEFEPWQRAGAIDVRVVREIYPSRVSLSFLLADEDGKVLKEGERKLASTVLYGDSLAGGDGPLRYEKVLLREWLVREFPAPAGPARAGR